MYVFMFVGDCNLLLFFWVALGNPGFSPVPNNLHLSRWFGELLSELGKSSAIVDGNTTTKLNKSAASFVQPYELYGLWIPNQYLRHLQFRITYNMLQFLHSILLQSMTLRNIKKTALC